MLIDPTGHIAGGGGGKNGTGQNQPNKTQQQCIAPNNLADACITYTWPERVLAKWEGAVGAGRVKRGQGALGECVESQEVQIYVP